MKKSHQIIMAIIVFTVLFSIISVNDKIEETISKSSNDIISIDPRIEFISGLISQSNISQSYFPINIGSEYYRNLVIFFDKHKSNDTINKLNELIEQGFINEKIICFMMCLDENMNLRVETYPNSLTDLFDESELEQFRISLQDLYEKSDFYNSFYSKHIDDYNKIIKQEKEKINYTRCVSYIGRYSDLSNIKLAVVLAPALYPNGGNATSINVNGRDEVIALLRADESAQDEVNFQSLLDSVTVHEWLHCFINPIIEKNKNKINQIHLNYPLSEDYNEQYVMLLEQIIHGIQLEYIKLYYGNSLYEKIKKANIQQGLYLSDYYCNKIDEYFNGDNSTDFEKYIEETFQEIEAIKENQHYQLNHM